MEGQLRPFWPAVCCVLALTGASLAQRAPDLSKAVGDKCGGTHRPGDRLTCYVSFAGKTHFTRLEVEFGLDRETTPRRYGTYLNFVLRDSKRIGNHTYAVSGVVLDCVPGTYTLRAVSAHIDEDWLQYGQLEPISVEIENDTPRSPELDQKKGNLEIFDTPPPDPNMFPELKSIEPAPAPPVEDLVQLISRIFHRPDSCGGRHRYGDRLVCYITFAGNPRFQTVSLDFLRTDKHTSRYQHQLCQGFGVGTVNQDVTAEHQTYKVTDRLTKCASGKYVVEGVGAFGFLSSNPNKVYFKEYRNGKAFSTKVVLKVKDTSQKKFPPIVAVGGEVPPPIS
jgi:hypothetical protein